VKPSNILLDSDGCVRLADFGIAKSIRDVTGDLTATGQLVGTASYLAPELGRGEPATPSSDLYAVGIIIFEMLTGEVPMRGENAVATLALRQHAARPSLRSHRADVPEALDVAVATALSADPANRFASAREMRAAIDSHHAAPTPRTEADATSPYRPTVPPQRKTSRAGRHRRLAGIAAVLAVLAAGAAVLLGIDATDHGTSSAQTTTTTTDSAANAAPPTSGPTTTVASPPTTTPVPRSLTELIALLSTPGNRFGVQQQALRARLLALIDRGQNQHGKNVSALSRDVNRWASTGQLDPAIANDTRALLAGLPQEQPPIRKPPKHEDGPQNSDSQS
jgi:serine/threonine protein kinase